MKTKILLLSFIAILLFSCSPTAATAPTQAGNSDATFTPISTLPPTLTPVPTLAQAQGTPTAIYFPVKLSTADDSAYQKALIDIPLNRQGNIQINVQNEQGNPLAGYQVKYRQTSHDFLFGAIADPFYATELKQAGVNTWSAYMWWRNTEPELGKFDLEFANEWLGIDELKTGGITIRTNVLYDTGDMPPYYKDVSYDEFLKRLYDHEANIVKRFSPSVSYWEAVLEPNLGNHNPLNLTKDEYYQAIATSIKAIRDNDPTATVEINFSYPCGGIDRLNNFQILQEMLDKNIDFDALGLQFYYNAYIGAGNYQMTKLSFDEMSACYDKYEKMLVV